MNPGPYSPNFGRESAKLYAGTIEPTTIGYGTSEFIEMLFQAGRDEKCQPASVVYFVRRASGPVKIGYAANLRNRVSMLRKKYGEEMEVLATVPGGRVMEGAYHFKFRDHQLNGEWFNLHTDLLDEIERLKK